MTDDEYYEGIFGKPERPIPTPEYVKLIPADSIPVFVFSQPLTSYEMDRLRDELKDFFGDRRFLAIRADEVQIYAIEDMPHAKPMQIGEWPGHWPRPGE